jgi:hypothetical protein
MTPGKAPRSELPPRPALLRHTRKYRTDGAGTVADHWKGKEFKAIMAGDGPGILMHIKHLVISWRWPCRWPRPVFFLIHVKSRVRKPPSGTAMLDLPVLPF